LTPDCKLQKGPGKLGGKLSGKLGGEKLEGNASGRGRQVEMALL